VVLGTAITRVGCLLFGCDYGQRTAVSWAIRFPGPSLANPQGSPAWRDHVESFGLARDALLSFPVHPTQVYEMMAGLFLFGLLMLLRRVRRFSGQVFLGWIIGYGLLRPLIEVYRDDDQRGNVGPLSTSQFIGLTSVVLGVALLVHLIRRYRQDPQGSRLWERPLEVAPVAARPARAQKRRKAR
jgi:phosphatidylglycerol---prolipoprotein diacylglyceryl transferase